jgi:two-component system alkaline phosphatase synthesis response regulator PhoP
LVARIKAALRRLRSGSSLPDETMLRFENLRIDTGRREVWVREVTIDLTATEFDLFVALAEHPGRVLSREQLLEKVWGYDYYGEIRVVDVHIGHIRQKIGDEEIIKTVRGVGYRFNEEGV